MVGEFLLDTNIVIALFAQDENVSQNFDDASGGFTNFRYRLKQAN